jgi:hypothetical protein
MELLRPIGILLFQAIDPCVASRLRPGEQPIIAQKRHEAASHITNASKNLTEIVDDLLVAKQNDGLSIRYLEAIRSHLTRFAGAFPGILPRLPLLRLSIGCVAKK